MLLEQYWWPVVIVCRLLKLVRIQLQSLLFSFFKILRFLSGGIADQAKSGPARRSQSLSLTGLLGFGQTPWIQSYLMSSQPLPDCQSNFFKECTTFCHRLTSMLPVTPADGGFWRAWMNSFSRPNSYPGDGEPQPSKTFKRQQIISDAKVVPAQEILLPKPLRPWSVRKRMLRGSYQSALLQKRHFVRNGDVSGLPHLMTAHKYFMAI